jgi:hypothetical protein
VFAQQQQQQSFRREFLKFKQGSSNRETFSKSRPRAVHALRPYRRMSIGCKSSIHYSARMPSQKLLGQPRMCRVFQCLALDAVRDKHWGQESRGQWTSVDGLLAAPNCSQRSCARISYIKKASLIFRRRRIPWAHATHGATRASVISLSTQGHSISVAIYA